MSRIFSNLWTVFAMATLAIGTNAIAQQNADKRLAGVAGYDPAQGGSDATSLTPGTVSGTSYTVTLKNVIGVSFEPLNSLKPYRETTDVPTKRKIGLYNLPDGTVVHAFALGREWGNMSTDVANVELPKAKAKGNLAGGSVTLTFEKGTERCRVVNWVAVLPDGQRVWSSHPEGWQAKNVVGAPMTGWCFEGDKIVGLDRNTIAALATKK